MNKRVESMIESGTYTSNLLGNIRSHLQGLQGFDTMALELIQNADDAEAKCIIFDVRDDGLSVWNSGRFTYCGELSRKPCLLHEKEGYSCDFHRVTDFGSGGKLTRSENIGRFGIGFSSTYQITDYPEIQSAGIKLTLIPEEAKWQSSIIAEGDGTTFFLPWATDPDSSGRQALGVSHITPEHVEKVVVDCEKVLRHSLLFLRNLEKAELRCNGEILLAVELDRGDDAELIVSFEPKGEIERWFIVRADAASQTGSVYEKFPQLEPLNRKTEISMAIRVDPVPLVDGYLYAFLPTRQATGFPFHLNADFFPEDSRKAIIFEGHQHQQVWNELLVRTAANVLADDLEGLRDRLGYVQLWELLSRALTVEQDKKSQYPECLKSFWDYFKAAIANGAKVGYSAKHEYESPSKLLIPRKPLSEQELSAFHQMGGELVNEALRTHRNALVALDVKELTLQRFVDIANDSFSSTNVDDSGITQGRLDALFKPLWAIAQNLLPETATHSPAVKQSIVDLKKLRFVVNTNFEISNIDSCYSVPQPITGKELTSSLQFLPCVNDQLALFPKLYELVDRFDIGYAATEINARLVDGETDPQEVIGSDPQKLRTFYTLLARLDDAGEDNEDAYATLRSLPIWMTSKGLSSAEYALLPGDFEDPTGQAEVLTPSYLSPKAKEFIQWKLRIQRQTIEEFVRTVVPRFFGSDGPEDLDAYQSMIVTLANHAGLLDDDEIRSLLEETPLVPTRDNDWQRPGDVYYRTHDLVALFGDNRTLWVDEIRLPNAHSVQAFINSLGVLHKPIAAHLVDRLLNIANASPPDAKARKASEKVFYELCDVYEDARGNSSVETAVERLVSVHCLPVDGDSVNWHMPEEIYAPFRYQAFSSQAPVLDFKNYQRLSGELRILSALGISITPETQLVVDHLLHCVVTDQAASSIVYQLLNERAKKGDAEIARLCREPCIYLDAQKRYVRPNQLYLVPQQLGKYSFSIPVELDQFKALFSAIGVKDAPDLHDYIDIVLDIVEGNYTKQTVLKNEDLAIYEHCMQRLAESWSSDIEVDVQDIDRLRKAPSVLNIQGIFCHPDELLIHDSEWHADHFGDELLPALCKPDAEWWLLFAELGVKRLTQVANVELDFIDGDEREEREIAELILERCDVFARMLHDKPREVRKKLGSSLQNLTAKSYDLVRTVASVAISGTLVTSESRAVNAYYGEQKDRLILARPMGERSWLYIYNAILHRLMPEEPSSQIAQLGMNFFQMMSMSISEANEFLTEARVPFLDDDKSQGGYYDLTSPELGDLGTEANENVEQDHDNIDHDVSDVTTSPVEKESSQNGDRETNIEDDGEVESTIQQADNNSIEQADDKTGSKSSQSESGSWEPNQTSEGVQKKPRKRAPHKKLWDRKLISYVTQKDADEDGDKGETDFDRDFKLSIEAASRELVCEYERGRGREPEEMAQTHPGFDIISCSAETGVIERYIEVKGTSGEWSKRGVSVSRLQFSEAQNYGDQYWLYVVEHALDKEGARLYAIQSPAMKVDSFMFDGEWGKIAVDESADPTLRYLVGVRIDCGVLGEGVIEKIAKRGQVISLMVDFGKIAGKKLMPLNLKTMRIIEEDHGVDDT